MEVAGALKEFGQSLAKVAAEDDMATGKGRNIDPAMVGKGKSKKGKGKPKGHNIDPALVGKGRPGEAHPAMWKHMKTEMGGVWLEPQPQEEPVQDQEPPPEAERQEDVEYNPSAWFGVVGYDGLVKTGVDDELSMLIRKSRRSRHRIRNHRLRQSARSPWRIRWPRRMPRRGFWAMPGLSRNSFLSVPPRGGGG